MLLFGLNGTPMDTYSPETVEELEEAVVALATGKRSPFDVKQALHFHVVPPPFVINVSHSLHDKKFGIYVEWRGERYYLTAPSMEH